MAEHYPSPTDPRRQKYEERITTPGKHRPAVQKAIEEEHAEELKEGLFGGKISQLLLAGMLRRANPPVAKSCHPANKYWNLLHFVSMVWLGFLAVYEEISYHGVKQVVDLIKDPSLKENVTIHFVSIYIFFLIFHYFACANTFFLKAYLLVLCHTRDFIAFWQINISTSKFLSFYLFKLYAYINI